MVSIIGALALLLTCAGISTGQRKVSRNIALIGDQKPDASFNCPDEFGYYPHPSDCTLYYVCFFGGALLESCTGGLMYSPELQTCDWPRNVGCEANGEIAVTAIVSSSSSPSRSTESRSRYTAPAPPPPPARPAAIVTSRGQSRQLHHNQELIKQQHQQQLYEDTEEVLPHAERLESDKRVYRGQPSTVGQVQRDRDGLRHTNAIPYSGRGEKISVISFSSQQQPLQTYSTDEDFILTNDLTPGRKRHKRQIQSQQHPWHGKSYSRIHPSMSILQPPPQKRFKPSYQTNFVPFTQEPEEFKPFFPSYYIQPNFFYDLSKTTKPQNENFPDFNLRVTAPSQAKNYIKSSPNITNYKPTIVDFALIHHERPKITEAVTKSYKNHKPFYEYDDHNQYEFSPYQKNIYENVNPFTAPNFDFEKYFNYPKENFEKTTEKPRTKTTEKIKTTTPNDYYYYDDEEVTKEITKQKITTPAYTKTTKPQEDEYYYDDDYEYENETPKKNQVKNTTNENKYSAKYKTELTSSKPHVQKTSFMDPLLTTTPTPIYTIRSRIKTTYKTTPTRSNRHRPNMTDIDIRPDNKKIRVEDTSVTPQKTISTATVKAIYNGSQHYDPAHYDPYYNLYDDDVELYRDIDYSQQYNTNNRHQNTYRGTPAPSTQAPQPEETPKRRPTYTYSTQDVYQQPTVDYTDDNSYGQVDDQSNYRQTSRQPSSLRGDRNELNFVEEPTTTTKRTTTTRTTTTTTTTPRPIPTQKSTVPVSRSSVRNKENQTRAQSFANTLPEDPGHNPSPITTFPITLLTTLPTTTLLQSPPILEKRPDTTRRRFPDISLNMHENVSAVFNQPTSFSTHLTTQRPSFHYITKPSKSTPELTTKSEENYSSRARSNRRIIKPTTYAPPKFFLKSLLPKTIASSTISEPPIFTNNFSLQIDNNESSTIKQHKTIKAIRKYINPIAINNEFSGTTDNYQESSENVSLENVKRIRKIITTTPPPTTTATTTTATTTTTTTRTTTATTSKPKTTPTTSATESTSIDLILRQIQYKESNLYVGPNEKRFRTTIEVPKPEQVFINKDDLPKPEPDLPPSYKPKPIHKLPKTDSSKTVADGFRNTSIPARVSRVNTAIKSLIAFGGTQRPKCTENLKCNDLKQRTNTRGRGSAHYSNTGNAEVVNVNRGTPPPRSRPTLKPSTSIVSKAQEFIDIYKYLPRRPDPIYPQPQPDKTAAKCRKDVCLLPDCSCGGKEIPGDLPAEQVPQIVLLTFDDSVNDLNKGLYSDLFEKGRVNPNGCPIAATFYVSHEWTDYSQVQNLYSDGHEIASHTVSHSFGEQFSQKKWTREVGGQREILSAYGGVKLEDVRGMRAPFLSIGGNKMFKMLYDSNFTYDSSMPIYENKPPSYPYTLDYKLFHDCMIPPCPTRSYPGVWEVPMVMWQDLNGGRCSMGDACSNPPDAAGVLKVLLKNFERHYTTNRAPFGLFYHAAWFTQPHHKEGFITFLDTINAMKDVYLVTNWQAIQWVRDPTPISRIANFQPFQCNYPDRPKRCNNPKVCNLWHKSGVRYMRTCQPCPDIYPWTGNTGIRSSRIDNDIED